jgi:two-component system sensor histidine kinase PilS (NtrC family)
LEFATLYHFAANMSFAEPRHNAGDHVLYEKALRLIIGRVSLVLLLLLASFWRTGGLDELAAEDNPDGLLLLFSATFALSVVYFLLLRLAPQALWQVRVQFAIDVISITWLVTQTGDIISPYVTLYVVLVSVAGFFLGKTETLVLAMISATAFTTLSVLASNGLLDTSSGDQPSARVLQIVGVNDIAILLVGLLAARLSERRRLSDELKHTEESFADLHLLHERIVESIGSGLITTDLSGRIYSFNRAAEAITSVRSANAIGKSVVEIFGAEMGPKLEHCLDSARAGEPAEARFESGFQNGSGPPKVTAICTVVPLRGKSGITSGLIVTLQDVTEMRDLEETVRRSDRLAAVGRMAAGLAHEIRNPLGSMSSALQFLQERSERPKDEAKLMDVVLRESERMNNIITNFLAFARPTASSLATKRGIIDLSPALTDCVSLIKHSPEATDRHEFSIYTADGLFVQGDETELKQVWWNLARNSIEAMPQGGVLSVSACREGGAVSVSFSDTGVGVEKGMIERMFEPFVSGSGGSGLGLSIVHRIVQEHGGRISVDSEPGKGTTVKVEFPRAEV